jgi:hypothetical protein
MPLPWPAGASPLLYPLLPLFITGAVSFRQQHNGIALLLQPCKEDAALVSCCQAIDIDCHYLEGLSRLNKL